MYKQLWNVLDLVNLFQCVLSDGRLKWCTRNLKTNSFPFWSSQSFRISFSSEKWDYTWNIVILFLTIAVPVRVVRKRKRPTVSTKVRLKKLKFDYCAQFDWMLLGRSCWSLSQRFWRKRCCYHSRSQMGPGYQHQMFTEVDESWASWVEKTGRKW